MYTPQHMAVLVGLIGGPDISKYSVANIVWKQLLAQENFDAQFNYYSANSTEDAISILEKVRSGAILGVNIALPWKSVAADYCDIKSDAVRASGYANTVYSRQGKLIACNTDGRGFIQGLAKYHMDDVLLFGAGGAGTVTAYELVIAGADVVVVDVKKDATDHLIHVSQHWSNREKLGICNPNNVPTKNFDLIINATPLGRDIPFRQSNDSHDDFIQESPVAFEVLQRMPKSCVCAEMNYYPKRTKFLSDAVSLGLNVVPGLAMLIYQAALSFTEYTGYEVTPNVLHELSRSLTNILYDSTDDQ